MAELSFQVESGLKQIKCNKYGDYITINVSDASVFDKFSGLYSRVMKIDSESAAKTKDLQERYGTDNIKDFPAEGIIEYAKLNTDSLRSIVEELDSIFGKDCIRKVFRECYEADEYFLPNQLAIEDFLEKIFPIMEDCFGERLKNTQKKYNVNRHGGKN